MLRRVFLKIRIVICSLLGLLIVMFLLLMILTFLVFPIVRTYTVYNNTDNTIYVTPLATDISITSKEYDDSIFLKKYIETEAPYFTVSQYLTPYDIPAIPAVFSSDIKIKSKSKALIYISYEDISQINGPHVLLIKDVDDNYYYKEASLWSQDTINDLSELNIATEHLLMSHSGGISFDFVFFVVIIFLVPLIIYLTYRRVVKLGKKLSDTYRAS